MSRARGRDVEAAASCERDGEAERNSLGLIVLVPVKRVKGLSSRRTLCPVAHAKAAA